jgi:hypothetical protein
LLGPQDTFSQHGSARPRLLAPCPIQCGPQRVNNFTVEVHAICNCWDQTHRDEAPESRVPATPGAASPGHNRDRSSAFFSGELLCRVEVEALVGSFEGPARRPGLCQRFRGRGRRRKASSVMAAGLISCTMRRRHGLPLDRRGRQSAGSRRNPRRKGPSSPSR